MKCPECGFASKIKLAHTPEGRRWRVCLGPTPHEFRTQEIIERVYFRPLTEPELENFRAELSKLFPGITFYQNVR